MPDVNLTPEEIDAMQASDDMAQHALKVPATGTYVARIVSARARRTDSAASYGPNRTYFMLTMLLYQLDIHGRLEPNQVGKCFVRVSPQTFYRDNGDLDNMAQLYVELADAVRIPLTEPGDILKLLMTGGVFIRVYGKDSWRDRSDPKSKRVYLEPGDDDKRTELHYKGYQGEYSVFNIRPHFDKGVAGGGLLDADDDSPKSTFGEAVGASQGDGPGTHTPDDDIPF